MKHILLLSATALVCLSLAACGNQASSHHSAASSSTSSKVVKHHKSHQHKAKQSKKETSQSSNSSNNSTNNSATSSNRNNTEQSQQQASTSSSTQNSKNADPSADNLSDFVNKYGESPAAYKMDHDGMSARDALMSTPNNMKSSGEIQDTYMYQNGQDPFAGN